MAQSDYLINISRQLGTSTYLFASNIRVSIIFQKDARMKMKGSMLFCWGGEGVLLNLFLAILKICQEKGGSNNRNPPRLYNVYVHSKSNNSMHNHLDF